MEEAVAQASGQPLAEVREANMLSGDIAAVARAARTGQLAGIQLQVFHPLQFMLASPEPTAAAILDRLAPPVWLEEKYDGIRCQVHKLGPRVELYSRDLHRITAQFPDLARAAADLPDDFIGDGELLAWRDGRALPFAELQKRLGRKGDDFFLGGEIPVSISFYDLLWRNGRVLLKEPLSVRRAELAAILAKAPPAFTLAPTQQASTTLEIEAAFLAARHRGNEGLMAKDPASSYTPGRRGLAWLKLKKAYATLDVVVVAVELGHGKRRDVLSDYTFAIRDPEHDRLLTVGKAYSGLTDVEIAELTQHFIAHTLEEKGAAAPSCPMSYLRLLSIPSSAATGTTAALRCAFPESTGSAPTRPWRRSTRWKPAGGSPAITLSLMFHPVTEPRLSGAALGTALHPELATWFTRRFGTFAPAQRITVPPPSVGSFHPAFVPDRQRQDPRGLSRRLRLAAAKKARERQQLPAGIVAIYVSPGGPSLTICRKTCRSRWPNWAWDLAAGRRLARAIPRPRSARPKNASRPTSSSPPRRV